MPFTQDDWQEMRKVAADLDRMEQLLRDAQRQIVH